MTIGDRMGKSRKEVKRIARGGDTAAGRQLIEQDRKRKEQAKMQETKKVN